MDQKIKIKKAATFEDYARCIQVRTKVFVIGQNVPAEREIDQYENECTHVLALYEGVTAGVGRWRRYDGNAAKIERMAVLENMRGRQIGQAILDFLVDDIRATKDIERIILSSQDHAIPFYERAEFVVKGDGYEDGGGIPHHDMVLELRKDAA